MMSDKTKILAMVIHKNNPRHDELRKYNHIFIYGQEIILNPERKYVIEISEFTTNHDKEVEE